MSTELDLQMMLFDQFLNSSEATLAIQDTSITSGDEYEQAKDSFPHLHYLHQTCWICRR